MTLNKHTENDASQSKERLCLNVLDSYAFSIYLTNSLVLIGIQCINLSQFLISNPKESIQCYKVLVCGRGSFSSSCVVMCLGAMHITIKMESN